MKVGVIGTGNMGSILIASFIDSLAVKPSQLKITNRTIDKAYNLKKLYPDLEVTTNSNDVVQGSDIIFICVKPLEFHSLLEGLKSQIKDHQLVVSITSPVTVSELESVLSCNVARVIPSITNRALSGASLITFGSSCTQRQRNSLLDLMAHVSTPIKIEENVTRVSSDITSCGPAFFSYIVQRFIDGAVEETEISREQATVLASEMLIGMGKLLEKEFYSLATLQEKVHVKGGVTGEGLSVLEEEIGDLFNHLFQKTHLKYDEDREKVSEQFHLEA
ncbi:late competence protein ComER [Pseudalkalibacillus caeni]|uniref:Pyrroline-5-carboxylate reductase n=1 Tax=Exobacillus caeni TaxID=2574798 RepID=A0A5R9F6V9_9BACL|nr:late competence protein ComER [Pseudalkalibacillus caeni]TLS39337.1 late competence protein ComER [Pseudalkalibacillus caeni]